MLLKCLRRKATTADAVEICPGGDILYLEQDTLTLEQRVTRYFEQWRDPVLRYLVAVFGHPIEAEEITQEAFLQLYRALHGGQVITNVSAWVFRVAHNLAVNRIRSQQFVDLLDERSWGELRQSLEDAGPTPEQSLIQQERLEGLRISISRLTAPERQCLHLRTKGLRYREIGVVLELSTTTVAETLYRVIDKLTKETNG